jgi:NodT family efflux transporter outer membrane factor (OMF) lipoprotein
MMRRSAGRAVRTLARVLGLLALVTGCTVGPDYVRPSVGVPAAYKELDDWKVAQPNDEVLRGAWWELFADLQLNALERQVDISNQNLVAAEAQVRQARALVRAARAGYFPTAAAGASVSRSRQSSNVGGVSGTAGSVSAPGRTTTEYALPLDVAWELDLWGRIRRTVESSRASAQASAADLEAARLSAQAELAQDYFELRALDRQKQLLDATVSAYEKSLELTRNRYAGGVASRVDVAQAETQLETAQAQAIDTGVQRALLEHAIAVLVGAPPANLSIPVAPLATAPPPIPGGLPSALLERRPDIAGAERRVAAANAQIGVAQAAFYPTITLSASGGLVSSALSTLFAWPSRVWAIGAAISDTVFDGGLRRAQTDQALAVHDATVASYRQTVLTGFQEVEDNLAALRILADEARVQDDAVKSAQESVTLTTNQYKAGTVSYLNVITAQTIALTSQITAVEILGRRMTAAVLLIRALGGGWDASRLPSAQDVTRDDSRWGAARDRR